MAKIRIYTNESVDVAIAEGLKRRGVDAFSARDTGNLGLTDEEQLVYAGKKRRPFSPTTPIFFGLRPDGWNKEDPMTGSYTAIRKAIRSANAFESCEC